ncbi:MAG: tetratricopeptide repeat protein [Alphaproteobacteria bacterium]|nr:tetratricopeptide repeat protein [Alphaproteobacteria bacterium]
MRVTVFAATLLFSTPCFAMGGGGGGYGGMGSNMPYGGMHGGNGATDYAAALRLIRDQHYAEAIPRLEKALHARPRDADVLNYLGFTQRMVGNYQVSLDYYQRALALNPDHRGAREYMGELYLKLNQLANARTQLAELARLCPSGCEEKEVLTKSIASYEAAAASSAAQPTAAAALPSSASPAATPPLTQSAPVANGGTP